MDIRKNNLASHATTLLQVSIKHIKGSRDASDG